MKKPAMPAKKKVHWRTARKELEAAIERGIANTEAILAGGGQIREFPTGATRDTEHDKLDYDAFLSPQAFECFALYMDFHRNMPDGSRRDGDNWQKGFPFSVLMKSMWRHFFSLWREHRHVRHPDENRSLDRALEHPLIDLCGIMFNVQAYMRQLIEDNPESMEGMLKVLREQKPGKLAP